MNAPSPNQSPHIRIGSFYRLGDGRVLEALDVPNAPGGIVLFTDDADFILYESRSDGRAVVALWRRVRNNNICGDCGGARLVFEPTDWTTGDLTPL
jgi:hypothetical protein